MDLQKAIDTIRDISNTARPARSWFSKVTVQYEFDVDGDIKYFHVVVDKSGGHFRQGRLPEEDSDVIIRTTPGDLLRVIRGEVGGREAMMSGLMDLKRVSSMPKLLVLRSLFNRYKKNMQRSSKAENSKK